jgi:lipoprotein-anchoring transpeptidase ErfK/SrfK
MGITTKEQECDAISAATAALGVRTTLFLSGCPPRYPGAYSYGVPGPVPPPQGTAVAALPPEHQLERAPAKALPARFHRTIVDYPTVEPAGTIIIDTPNTYLYLTISHDKAIRYGIGVGREGFTWSGTEHISRMKEWPHGWW